MKKIYKYIIATVVILILSFWILLQWTFWEPSDVKKDSFIYMMMVPSEVKEFPTWKETSMPEYDVNIADGLKPSAVIMRYRSSLIPEELSSEALKAGFTCQQYQDGGAICEKNINAGQMIQVIADKKPKAQESQVEVIFLGY